MTGQDAARFSRAEHGLRRTEWVSGRDRRSTPPSRRESHRSEVGRAMTVCLGTIAIDSKRIFLIADAKLTGTGMQVENATAKIRGLTGDGKWWCAVACEDITGFESVYRRILKSFPTPDEGVDLDGIVKAIEKAYTDEISYTAEIEILRPFRIARQAFDIDDDDEGGSLIMQEAFGRVHAAVEQLTTGVWLIVAGFDPSGTPHVLQVDAKGKCSIQDSPGFAAIGEGSQTAFDSLTMNSDFRFTTDRGRIIYRLCEAKFAAEQTCSTVGKTTTVVTIEPDGSMTMAPDDAIDRARIICERRRATKLPPKIMTALSSGETLDRNLRPQVHAVGEAYGLLSRRHTDVVARLRACGGTLTPEQSKRVESLSKHADALWPRIQGDIATWANTTVKPDDGLSRLLRYFEDAIVELESYAQAASATT